MFSSKVLLEPALSKKFMWKNMTQTEYRDEQLLAYDILKVLFPKDSYSVKMEFPVEECKAVLDLVVLPKNQSLKRIGIRMMGEIHEKNYKIIRDEDQKTMLNKQGWRVYDFWKDNMPHLWDLDITEAGREIRKELLF